MNIVGSKTPPIKTNAMKVNINWFDNWQIFQLQTKHLLILFVYTSGNGSPTSLTTGTSCVFAP